MKNKIMASSKALPLPSSATGQQVCNRIWRVSAHVFAGYVCRAWTRLVPLACGGGSLVPGTARSLMKGFGAVAWLGTEQCRSILWCTGTSLPERC